MTFSHKIQVKTFSWPDMSFYARKVTLMHQTKESNKRAPGRVAIYISVHLAFLAFRNVSLVLALNFMVHKSSHCKCSLAWCQVRTFLLFTIWTHLLHMREYPLRYAGTDRTKKSHYNELKRTDLMKLKRKKGEKKRKKEKYMKITKNVETMK